MYNNPLIHISDLLTKYIYRLFRLRTPSSATSRKGRNIVTDQTTPVYEVGYTLAIVCVESVVGFHKSEEEFANILQLV